MSKWLQSSYDLAQQLASHHVDLLYLTPIQIEPFHKALQSVDDWQLYMQRRESFSVRTMLLEQQVSKTPSSKSTPLLDVYHSLEYDMAAMMQQRKLEHIPEPSIVVSPVQPPLIMNQDFEYQHLLKGISENRDKTQLSDEKLLQMLNEIQPIRVPSVDREPVYDQELNEAMEHVLTELKEFTEHSFPFLVKVSKREAPDYYDVIQNPMDLGTMTKKLKNQEYKTKKSFVDDLYLIYDNCLTYNILPESEYRTHAMAMKRKSDRLLIQVPLEKQIEEKVFKKRRKSSTPQIKLLKPKEQLDDNYEDYEEGQELQSNTYFALTKTTRAKYTSDLFFPFAEMPTIQRSPFDMERFYMVQKDQRFTSCSKRSFWRWISTRTSHQGESSDEEEEEFEGNGFYAVTKKPDLSARSDLFLPDYNIGAGIPEIYGIAEEYIEQEARQPLVYVEEGLSSSIQENIIMIQQMKSTYHKCKAFELDCSPLQPSITSVPNSPQSEASTPIPTSTATNEIELCRTNSQHLLQKSIIQLLAHAGFDTAHSTPLTIMTDLMAEYFINLGTTLRKYLDQHHDTMKAEDILHLTLKQNGTSVSDLDSYVNQGIFKFGNQLSSINRQLESSFRQLAVQGSVEEDEALVYDIQDDFFGLKELGVIAANQKIPLKLILGHERPVKKQRLKYPQPNTFIPITEETPIIGLLKPFYSAHLHDTEDEYLLHTKPTYPPLQDILLPSKRKKISRKSVKKSKIYL